MDEILNVRSIDELGEEEEFFAETKPDVYAYVLRILHLRIYLCYKAKVYGIKIDKIPNTHHNQKHSLPDIANLSGGGI